jgi:hypothetical protein
MAKRAAPQFEAFRATIKAIKEEKGCTRSEALRIYREMKGTVPPAAIGETLTVHLPTRDPTKPWTMEEILNMANADPDGPSGWVTFIPENTVPIGWNNLVWNVTKDFPNKVPKCFYDVYMNSVVETRAAYRMAEEQLRSRPAHTTSVSYEGWLPKEP